MNILTFLGKLKMKESIGIISFVKSLSLEKKIIRNAMIQVKLIMKH